MRRVGSWAAVLAAATLLALSFAPAGVRAQGTSVPPVATAITFVSAEAVDRDASGLFQNLRVNTTVSGTGTGVMQVSATLTPIGSGITVSSNITFLAFDGSAPASDRTASLLLPGPAIRASGTDGPWSLQLSAAGWTADGIWAAAGASNTTTTPPFAAASFSPWWATLPESVTYATPDADGDGLSDALVVHVPITVTAATPMTLLGVLSLGNQTLATAGDGNARSPSPGVYGWDLRFDGPAIRASGVDGPYHLGLILAFPEVLLSSAYAQTSGTLVTPAFHAADFDPPSAFVRAPITASLEPSSAGVPNALEVLHVPLHVRVAGAYEVWASPSAPRWTIGGPHFPPGPNTTAVRDLTLPEGDAVVDLTFSSVFLARLPAGGTFTVWVSAHRIGAPPTDMDSVPWTEHNVTAAELPSFPVAQVTVTATSSGQVCPVLIAGAFDPANHFFLYGAATRPVGAALSLALYPATFDLLLDACGGSVLQSLSVPGSENVTIVVPPAAPLPPDRYVVTLPSWNRTITDLVSSRFPGVSARIDADFAGDFDGAASIQELSLYLQDQAAYASTPAYVTLDGSYQWPYAAAVTSVQGAGPDLSTQPVTVSLRWDTPLAVPARPGPGHLVAATLGYIGSAYAPYAVELHLPSGGTGRLDLSANAWYGTIPVEPANVTVEPLGAGAWLLTPGGPPANYTGARAVATVTVSGATSAGTLDVAIGTVGVFAAAGVAVLVVAYVVLRRPPRRKA